MAGNNARVCAIIAKTIMDLNDAEWKRFTKTRDSDQLEENPRVDVMVALLKRFRASTDLIDRIVLRYLAQGTGLFNTRDNLNFAVSVAKLGASRPTLLQLAKVLARNGYRRQLEEIRALMKSQPNARECFLLLNHYITGSIESSQEEQELLSFGRRFLSPQDFDRYQAKLETHREEVRKFTY